MRGRKVWLFGMIAVVILALGFGLQSAGVVQALPPAQGPVPDGITISYPGRLSDDAGDVVADGSYDFTFALYDAASDGNLLWSEVQEKVAVKGGAFVVSLGSVSPISADLLEAGERWLEVAVRGPGEAGFTALAPRQQVASAAASPAAGIQVGAPCPHDHWGETWTGSGNALYINASASSGAQIWFNSLLTSIFSVGTIGAGVYGKSTSNMGVLGESTDWYGVQGNSVNNYGGYFSQSGDHLDVGLGGAVGRVNAADEPNSQLYLSANGDIILKLDNNGGGNNTLRVKDSGGTDRCTIDEAGNLNCTGGKGAVVETASHGWRGLWAVESPGIWLEDFGSATLVDGEATVAIGPIFAETINLEEEYLVFLTPLGQEPVLLFVTAKTAQGFSVKGVTLEGKPASGSFDYRIVAKRLGYEDVRLPEIPWQTEEVQP